MNEVIKQDTLQALKDTVTTAAQSKDELPNLHFDIANITGDSLILTVLGYTIVFLALLFRKMQKWLVFRVKLLLLFLLL